MFLLSLGPVREELGDRWTARSDVLWDTLERSLAKRMPPPDIVVSIDDVHVIAAITSVSIEEGRNMCLQILHSILSFFLGHDATKEISIAQVTHIKDDHIFAQVLDISDMEVVAEIPAAAEPRKPPPSPQEAMSSSQVSKRPSREVAPTEAGSNVAEDWRPPLAGRRFSHSFVSARRGAVRIGFEIVPVWRLDQEAVSAFYVRRELPSSLGSFDDFDREVIDHRLVDIMIPLLEEYRREGGMFALIVPGSLTTASARRPRTALISRCEPVLEIMRRAVVLQVDGFSGERPRDG